MQWIIANIGKIGLIVAALGTVGGIAANQIGADWGIIIGGIAAGFAAAGAFWKAKGTPTPVPPDVFRSGGNGTGK